MSNAKCPGRGFGIWHLRFLRQLGISNLAFALMALAAVTVLGPRSSGADEATPALANYDQQVDKAIDAALAYLAKQQQTDGSFASGSMRGSTGIASFCVMAFLAKGHTPGAGPYGDVINKGVDYVLSQAKPGGMIVGPAPSHGPMYCHTISTLMLSEVSGMVDKERQKKIDKVLPAALKLIVSAQQVRKPANQQGGWRYSPTSSDSDISCTGWALMSLRSARNGGSAVPKEAIDQAVKFIMNCRMPDGGFAYQPGGGSGLARTGTALLCLELCGRHADSSCAGAGDWILKHLPDRIGGNDFFYYALYYCSQGMFQLGGTHWEKWAAHIYELMVKFQQKDGSWPQGGGNEATAGPCYSTALAVLAMTVSYRQLPIYQR